MAFFRAGFGVHGKGDCGDVAQVPEPVERQRVMLAVRQTGEAWHNAWGGWTFDYDNTAYLMYHSGEKWNPYDNDPKLNALLEKQRSIYDVKEREKILHEIGR